VAELILTQALDGLETLSHYERTANALLAASGKHAVEHAARVLALYVGHYQRRHGPIDTAALAAPDNGMPTPEQIADRVEAMRVLAAALVIAAAANDAGADDAPRTA